MLDTYEVAADHLPPELTDLLAEQTAVVVLLERLPDGRVIVSALPELEPTLIAHARITMAKYHEALTNLT